MGNGVSTHHNYRKQAAKRLATEQHRIGLEFPLGDAEFLKKMFFKTAGAEAAGLEQQQEASVLI